MGNGAGWVNGIAKPVAVAVGWLFALDDRLAAPSATNLHTLNSHRMYSEASGGEGGGWSAGYGCQGWGCECGRTAGWPIVRERMDMGWVDNGDGLG